MEQAKKNKSQLTKLHVYRTIDRARTTTYAYNQSRPLSTSVSCLSYDSSTCDYIREPAKARSALLRRFFPTMINSHVHSACIHPTGREKKKERKGKKGKPVAVYFARLFPGIFNGDRHNVSLPV